MKKLGSKLEGILYVSSKVVIKLVHQLEPLGIIRSPASLPDVLTELKLKGYLLKSFRLNFLIHLILR